MSKYKTKSSERFLTLEDIACELGVTKERIRQIEMSALKKCKNWCSRHGYQLTDLLPHEKDHEIRAVCRTSWGNDETINYGDDD